MKVLFISENMGLRSSVARALPDVVVCKHDEEGDLIKDGDFTHIVVSEADQEVGRKTFEGIRRKLWMWNLQNVKVLRMGLKHEEADDYMIQPVNLDKLFDWLKSA